jgi:hypothetical protein
VEELEEILLPFFRRFLKNRMNGRTVSYVTVLGEFNEYLANRKNPILPRDIKRCIRYFTNFYSLFHPSKKFEVILPYFPYKYSYISGCAEVVVRTRSGIRLYVYNFTEGPIDAECLNYEGFRLQLSGRIFKKLTGEVPTSLACVVPCSKTVIYYSYRDDEGLEEMTPNQMVRRYGEHCAYCLQRNCSPLIDRNDRFGWRESEKQ